MRPDRAGPSGRVVDAHAARSIAHYSHLADRDRTGTPGIAHVEPVPAAMPEKVRAVAFLHDVRERTSISLGDFTAQGLTPIEREALDLLTREPGESYELYTLRIAWARRHIVVATERCAA